MAIICNFIALVFSFWPLIVAILILILTLRLIRKKKTDQLDELPEIKPHWLQGNMRFSENMNVSFEEHYKRMKGLRFCKFWNFQEQRLFVLDPDVCSKIMISDFEHFGYVPFVPKEYCDVSNYIFGLFKLITSIQIILNVF